MVCTRERRVTMWQQTVSYRLVRDVWIAARTVAREAPPLAGARCSPTLLVERSLPFPPNLAMSYTTDRAVGSTAIIASSQITNVLRIDPAGKISCTCKMKTSRISLWELFTVCHPTLAA